LAGAREFGRIEEEEEEEEEEENSVRFSSGS
jgi:hypothetical protein